MFFFNGRYAKDIPWLRVKDIKGSVLPPLRRRYVTVPGKPGAYHAGRDVGIRREVITIKVNGDSLEGLAEKKRYLAEWLDTEETAPFFYDHEPTKVYRAVLSEETNLDQVIYYGEVDLIFDMPDPYAEDLTPHVALLQGATAGAFLDDFTGIGTATDVIADENGLRLAKEGQDVSVVSSDWNAGTHTDTAIDAGRLVLRKDSDFSRVWETAGDWNNPENDLDGVVGLPGIHVLYLDNTPVFDFMDDMFNYSFEWRVQSAAGGTVTQQDGYVRVQGTNVSGNFGIDTQLNNDVVTEFPCTIVVFYRGRSGMNTRFIVEDGSTIGYTYTFADTDNQWNIYWFRLGTTGGQVYKNGVFLGNISTRASTSANQIQIDILNGTSGDFDIGAVYAAWGVDLGPPPANGWWTGTWETPYISLSTVGVTRQSRLEWSWWYDPYNYEEYLSDPSNFANFEVQYQLRINGVPQGWKTLASESEGNGSALAIPDLPKGTDVSDADIKLRLVLSTRDPGSQVWVEVLELYSLAGYYPAGTWDSPILDDIQDVVRAAKSAVAWAGVTPAGTAIKMYARFRESSSDPWGGWAEISEPGDPLPDIDASTDLSAAEIQYRFELTTDDADVTPFAQSAQLDFWTAYKPTGQWVSPVIPLEEAGLIGESNIFWTWNGLQTIQVEVSVDGGPWVIVDNDSEIPGVEGTEGSEVQVRVTLATFDPEETPVMNTLEISAKETVDSFIKYDGSAEGYPIFFVTVTGDNVGLIQILHVETGRFIQLEHNFAAGDEIEINHADESVILNGVHRLNLLNIRSRFFKLRKGTNTFEISPKSGVIVSMEWRERWK